jgi:nucleotide-binding universal stress UspA family protein
MWRGLDRRRLARLRGPERALLGSVSQAVATQAKCSVEIARRRRQTSEDVED